MTTRPALQLGDRVRLTRDTLMDKAGMLGRVVRKYVPMHCTGAWSITVRWDFNTWETSYSYPDPIIERVAE